MTTEAKRTLQQALQELKQALARHSPQQAFSLAGQLLQQLPKHPELLRYAGIAASWLVMMNRLYSFFSKPCI